MVGSEIRSRILEFIFYFRFEIIIAWYEQCAIFNFYYSTILAAKVISFSRFSYKVYNL